MIEDIRYSKKINWPLFILFLALMFVLLFYFDRAIAADAKEPAAVSMAAETIKAMGGMDAWKSVKAIRFDFRVEKEGAEPHAARHLWDRAHGRDHVEGMKDNKPTVAWIDLSTKTGAAWVDGKKQEGEALKQTMAWAYQRWVNDTYWLIMPFKWMDAGVNLKKEPNRNGFEILHVSFGQVGLTPGDQYWVFLNPKTHMMEHWEYLLQGEKEKGIFDWKNWSDYGPVKLSSMKTSPDGKLKIHFDPLQVQDSADAAYFGNELKTLP